MKCVLLSTNTIFLVGIILFLLICSNFAAKQCISSSTLKGKNSPLGQRNTENDSKNAVSKADTTVSINAHQRSNEKPWPDSLSSAPSCEDHVISNNTKVVALSTGWFDHRRRCLWNITTSGNGRHNCNGGGWVWVHSGVWCKALLPTPTGKRRCWCLKRQRQELLGSSEKLVELEITWSESKAWLASLAVKSLPFHHVVFVSKLLIHSCLTYGSVFYDGFVFYEKCYWNICWIPLNMILT